MLTGLSWRHTYVRYDEHGCGLSDWEAEGFSPTASVQDLETLVDILELERFPLISLCRSVAMAVAYAARHPDKVRHRLPAFPKGYPVTGDVLCSFNLTYCQEMKVAALEAAALDACPAECSADNLTINGTVHIEIWPHSSEPGDQAGN